MAKIPIENEDNLETDADDDSRRGPQRQGPDISPAEAAVGGGSDDVNRLRQERDTLFERLARTTADFQNARRRLEADLEQRAQYANSTLIKNLLPVIDNWERALAVDPAKADTASVLKGLELVHDQMMAVLGQANVGIIAPEPGTPFDPATMQALLQQASDQFADRPEPTVTQLLQKGYTLHGRTLRPASVAVSKTE